MNPHLSAEELVRLSVEEAVARQFDVSNVKALRIWSIATAFFVFIALGTMRDRGGLSALAALTVLALSVALFVGLKPLARGRTSADVRPALLMPIARAYERTPRALTLVLVISSLELLLLASWGGEAVMAIAIMLGFWSLSFCLKPVERLLVLAAPSVLCLIGLAVGLPHTPKGDAAEQLIGISMNNALALGIGLLVTRRARRQHSERFYNARKAAEQQVRMSRELAYAREIQLSMLPADCPPQGWLDVCSHSAPATEVGGDYYDYFELPDGRFAVVVGDVAGHGMASGLVLASVRSCLILLVEELGEPLGVLKKLNRMVQQSARRRTLVTLAIAVFDRDESAVTIASAGHPPMLVVRASTGAVEEIALPSLPLGTRLAESFHEQRVPVSPGDLLLLSSDGIFEAINEREDAYGFERLTAVLAAVPTTGSAASARDALLADLAQHRGKAAQGDDQTLVVVRVG